MSTLLSRVLDEELQALVKRASAELDFPIALVTLVLKHIQFFKAQVGLPEALAVTQATDRNVSFCQYVVRNGAPFLIDDSKKHPELPQELVDAYNIRAYAGFPVLLNNSVIGSFCVIDTKPRVLAPEQKELMISLARRASYRLQELHDHSVASFKLLENATGAAFGEARKILASLSVLEETQQVLLMELAPMAELVRLAEASKVLSPEAAKAVYVLKQAWQAHHELLSAVHTSKKLHAILGEAVLAIEESMQISKLPEWNLREAISIADKLALHATVLVGGVAWDHPEVLDRLRLGIDRSLAVGVLSSALSLAANQLIARRFRPKPGATGIIQCSVSVPRPGMAELLIRVPTVPEFDFEAFQMDLAELTLKLPSVNCQSRPGALALFLPLN